MDIVQMENVPAFILVIKGIKNKHTKKHILKVSNVFKLTSPTSEKNVEIKHQLITYFQLLFSP
jgi:hypothetical protein